MAWPWMVGVVVMVGGRDGSRGRECLSAGEFGRTWEWLQDDGNGRRAVMVRRAKRWSRWQSNLGMPQAISRG